MKRKKQNILIYWLCGKDNTTPNAPSPQTPLFFLNQGNFFDCFIKFIYNKSRLAKINEKNMNNHQYNYTVYFEPQLDGTYNVVVPAIPEICTFGETLKEAKAMAQDAILCYLESARDGFKI